jgi:hypothetical protein
VGHVSELRGESAPAREARVRHDAVALKADFHGLLRHPGFDAGVDQLIRHAVEVVIHLDVIIDVHSAWLPGRQLVPRARQRLQRGPIDLLTIGNIRAVSRLA